MIKAYIFDLDGTLVDSLGAIASCANSCLEEAGYAPHKTDDYRYFVGDGQYELIKRALIAAGDKQLKAYDSVMASYIKKFKDCCHIGCTAYDGMLPKLLELKARGIKIAVLSNKAHINTVKVIHEVYGDDIFDIVLGQRDGIPKKPAPDGVYCIMKELGLKPDECVYVGDTSVDMKTGKAAGVFTIGVTWGFRDRIELEENHADKIIDSPKEL